MRASHTLALILVVGLLVGVHIAIAALSECRNETPGLAIGLSQVVPISRLAADQVLRWLGQTPECDPAAHAYAMGVAAAAYLAGIGLLHREHVPRRLQWLLIGLGAGAIQLVLLLMPALLSSDVLDYAAYGRVAAIHGANPYLTPLTAFVDDPFLGHGAWQDAVTVYGPLWTRINAAVAGAFPAGIAVEFAFAFKGVALLAQLANIGLVWWLAGQWHAFGVTDTPRTVAVALYAWNPLLNIEVVGNGHMEGLMGTFVLGGMAILTRALQPRSTCRIVERLWLWVAAIVCVALGALVKFVPVSIAAIMTLVWLRRAPGWAAAARRVVLISACVGVLTVVMAWPWLDSQAIAQPLFDIAADNQRFKDAYKDAWQDAPAAYLAVRLVPRLGVPDDPINLRMDVARSFVWAATRALFAGYAAAEVVLLWKRARKPESVVLRAMAVASVRVLLLALLLWATQTYAWYFIWPLWIACLLGLGEPWSRAAIVFGLAFLPSFYLREFQPFGVFYLPTYGIVALAVLALASLAQGARARPLWRRPH